MKRFFIFMIFFAFSRTNWAGFNLSLFQGFSDNFFQNFFGGSDQVSLLELAYDKSWNNLSFYIRGEYSKFYKNNGASNYYQQIGLDYLFTSQNNSALYVDFNLSGNLFQKEFSDFNSLALGAMVAYKTYLTDASIFKISYSIQYKAYRYKIFDALKQSFSTSIDRYFTTRTTLKATLNWGYKFFFHPFSSSVDPLTSRVNLESNLPFFKGSASDHGKNGGPGYGRNFVKPFSSLSGQGIQILSLSGLLAQGISKRIGISFSFSRQWILSGESPFLTNGDFYLLENPAYDQFAYNENAYEIKLTVNAFWDILLKAERRFSRKDFSGIEALDLDGVSRGIIRKDDRTIWNLSLEKFFSRVLVYFSFALIKNKSNDDLYNWKENVLSMGLEWTFGKMEEK